MTTARVCVVLLALIPLVGCGTIPLGGGGNGRAYELDTAKIGTGQQTVVPTNDATHWNGTPLDARGR